MTYIIINAETGENIVSNENIKYLNKGDLISIRADETWIVWFKEYDVYSNIFYVQTEEN